VRLLRAQEIDDVGERTGKPRHNSKCNHRGHPRWSRRASRCMASGESWLAWAVIQPEVPNSLTGFQDTAT
jgi:hypothetical protein